LRTATAEEAFRRLLLFEQARDGIVVFDSAINIYEANESFARLLGYPLEEIAGLRPWDWDVKYHSPEAYRAAWPKVPETSGEFETQFRRRDGSIIDVAISYTPTQFNGSHYIWCICRDVTEQRKADRALHETEERFRRALANIPDVVVIYGPDLRIRYINDATCEITGLQTRDFIGKRDSEIFPPEVCSAYLPTLEDALESKVIRKVEATVPLPGKGHRLLRITCVPLLAEGGDVREVLGITEDLTERRAAEHRLRQSEEQYRELIEQAADGIFISDAEGKFVLVNSRCCELLGYERNDLLGKDGYETYFGEETSATTRRMALLASGQDLRYERILKRKDGSSFPAEISVKMLDSGGMQVIFHDITKRHRQERKIAGLSRIHAVLSGINSTIVRVRDRRELLREACRIAVDAGGFQIAWIAVVDPGRNKARILAQAGLPTDLVGADEGADPVVDLMPNGPVSFSLQEKRPVYENDIANSPHLTKVRRVAIRLGAKSVISLPLIVDGQVFAFLILYAPERNFFDDEELKLLRELASDISFALAYIAKGEKVDYLAWYDTLTGLPNRSLFFDALNRQMASAEAAGDSIALQLFDIDRFRMINDTYGRDGADKLIGEVAERLRAIAGAGSTIARVGPDSFALAITGTRDATRAAHALEQLNEQVFGRPFMLGQEELRLSATSGVAVFPGDGLDANSLLSNAEAALRDAERQNLRFLFYSSDMNERVGDSIRLENRLRQALEQDEILMWYQPKLCVKSRKLTGFEALMRWQDRESGELVQPAGFIPIMEQTGLILEAGQRALHKVVTDCGNWETLPATSIAVNVSLMQLRQANFVDKVIEAQSLVRHAGWVLELELTESVLMDNLEAIVPKLNRLRSLGVLISVDDFGTGYSSLAYISRLPIHCLKIDRSFILGMSDDQNNLTIVKSIITLAHSLGLKVVAEGVETDAQIDLLGALDCDEIQGYCISMPVAPENVPFLVRKLQ
jgi:diguanylate cyclase (GGDEF)-like protein/PAS domain S-box-containing protein